jgi:histidinol phosphatase-like PHP family hydrolase
MMKKRAAVREPRADVNATVGNHLRDLAFAQVDQGKAFAYKRAAAVILALEDPVEDLFSRGRFQKLPGIGPSSERVIREILDTGSSPTVEQAVDTSGKRADITRRRSLRTNFLSRAAVIRILSDASLGGPAVSDIRADLQMHSVWSDGAHTIGQLRDACTARKYTFAAVTDHSYGLKIARGMSMQGAAAQRAEILAVNSGTSHGCEMLQGIEANIGGDGELDLSPEEATRFDLVLAAPHSLLRKTDDQTERMLTAVGNPAVRILAHPRGRLSGSRAGVAADWNAVFAAAAASGVAIEIDGDPSRQDLDFALASSALEAGVIFAVDSDAHTTDQLIYSETAVAHARLAGISPDRIVNCWSLELFRSWLAEPRREARLRPSAATRSRPR